MERLAPKVRTPPGCAACVLWPSRLFFFQAGVKDEKATNPKGAPEKRGDAR